MQLTPNQYASTIGLRQLLFQLGIINMSLSYESDNLAWSSGNWNFE